MQLTFLGTGTSAGVPELGCNCRVCSSSDPKDRRTRSSLLIENGDQKLLIDCGPDFRYQAIREGFSRVDALLLTHAHFDHIAGLEEMRPLTRHKALPVCCEPYVAKQLRNRLAYCFQMQGTGYAAEMHLCEFDANPFELTGLMIEPIRLLHHRLPICGFRIGKLAYLTDFTEIAETELAKLEGVEFLIIEALRQTEHIAHISMPQALEYIDRIGAAQNWLIHMNHQFGLHEEIQQVLPDHVTVAYDGLKIQID
ncbi:MAG: MBL fold metallo-hydrolase [Bacteroidales bacterium]